MSTIITNAGKKKIAEALAKGNLIKLKYLAVGDGNGYEIIPDPYMRELVNETYRNVITKYEVPEDNPNALILYLTIPSTVGGFTVREVGCFDLQNTLIAVGNTEEIVKPAPKDGYMNLTIRCVVAITSSEQGAIEVNIDPNFTIVQESAKNISKDAIKLHEENPAAHRGTIEEAIKEHNMDLNSHKEVMDRHNADPFAHNDVIERHDLDLNAHENLVVPIGGFKGQVLSKASDEDRDLVWKFVESTPSDTGNSCLKKDSTDNFVI